MPNLRPNSAYSSQPGVALVSSIYGEPVEQTKRPNTTGEEIALSVNTLHRPYEDPKLKPAKDPKLCADGDCRGYATKSGYCMGHSRKFGLTEGWKDQHEPD